MFTNHSKSSAASHEQEIEYWRSFGVQHHWWKFLGWSHKIYSHWKSTTIYILHRGEAFVALRLNMNIGLTPSNSLLCDTLQTTALYEVLRWIFGSTF